ncbi:MAG: YfbK domain-containing protein, partial [Psychrobacter alimentarius]
NSKSSTRNTQNINELAYLKIRYKEPAGGSSKLLSQPIYKTSRALNSANIDTQFAVAVAGFGQRLTQNEYINDWQYADSKKLASSVLTRQPSNDKDGIRRNFVTLTELATVLDSNKS